MSRLPLVVLSDPSDLPGYAGPVMTAEAFLGQEVDASLVINLCRGWRYLSEGYYVSLLAEARGLDVIPTVATIAGLQDPQRMFRALAEAGIPTVDSESMADRGRSLPAVIAPAQGSARLLVRQRENGSLTYRPAADADTARVVTLLGACREASFRRLAASAYRAWPLPVLELQLLREEERWHVVRVAPLYVHELEDADRDELARVIPERGKHRLAPSKRSRASLAVLCDPEDPHQPSSPETIERLAKVAARKDVLVQTISPGELERLGEFDALFIRTLTGPDLPSFSAALRAETLGMPVIDDTASVLRCCNKVYLHELLSRGGVPTPDTVVLSRQTPFERLRDQLDLPFVLKLPDGSFSSAVFKIANEEEFQARADPLLERSPLLLAQRFMPTAYDWRIGVLDGELLFAAKYFMAKGHWQIAAATRRGPRFGRVEAVSLDELPDRVRDCALRAASLIGQGFYGVDLKETDDAVVVIEVNDNPNLDLGYEDKAEGDRVYERIVDHFLQRIEAGFQAPAAAPRPGTRRADPHLREEELIAWRQPIEPAPASVLPPPYAAYAVCGLELEYAIVDRDLNASSLVEPALATLAGRPTSEVELGVVGLTNEITDHVFEIRTNVPLASLAETERVLVEAVRRTGALLADRFRGARLLPTSMHPWLVPAKAKLWRRSNRRIYGTYERLFDTATHGWRNVQSCHVNLPLGSEAEGIAMLNAAALMVPYLPALAASSPMIEGELGSAVDNRIQHLLTHQVKIPESQGQLVPEFATGLAQYKRDVLKPMYQAIDALPESGPIRREFLNARGAVFKFSRMALEVRVLDVQECVRCDVAIAGFVRWGLAALADGLQADALPDHELLVADLHAVVARGSQARVHAPHVPGLDRDSQGLADVRDVLRAFLRGARGRAPANETHYLGLVARMIESGSLSERIRAVLEPLADDDDAFTEAARGIYIALADCLLENEPWSGRGLAVEA